MVDVIMFYDRKDEMFLMIFYFIFDNSVCDRDNSYIKL